eukprot:TRINITY_DN1020_c5_g2_i3.p1 TRINITY_DN1020_c5_g2~~TRINITY_DN1020_c5_g2_i3.p1  ORF type:complete len:370 (+),score=54.04 TRINITY_DN1020_c5_g2_i3:130-1110(+)
MPTRKRTILMDEDRKQDETTFPVVKKKRMTSTTEPKPEVFFKPRYPDGWLMAEYKGAIEKSAITKELLSDCKKAFLKKSFWMPAGGKPRCAFEQYALQIYNEHIAKLDTPVPVKNSGAEWWIQIRGRGTSQNTEESLGFHWDRDEECAVKQGRVICPTFLTVTYLCDVGAPTVAIGAPPLPCKGSVKVPNMFVSHPAQGKHVVFRGDMLHGCPPEMMKQSKCAYTRVTLLVNIWVGHHPSEIEPAPLSLISGFVTPFKELFTKVSPTAVPPQIIQPGSSSPVTGFAFGRKGKEEHELWVPIPPKKSASLGTFEITCPKGCRVVRKT